MDIQKEREAFEHHLTDTGLVEFAGYGFEVDECDEYLHEPTQVAWDSWLIGLGRSKAQAVPEGFVLVPKDRLAKAVDGIEALFEEDCTLALGQLLPIQQDLNAMIEAQGPAND